MDNDELIEIQALGKKMKLSPKTIRRLVKYEGLPCCIINSRVWRFHWPTVLAWSQQR
jgi:hypothetical protein